uniref:Uncharacterized protein n=1 Tax=Myotis myotis TaxID=51298 RepID=A0A7J7Y123_MYOMY|nr:hypothetical protein mMyoMyo1_011528 [Myotis myotis]
MVFSLLRADPGKAGHPTAIGRTSANLPAGGRCSDASHREKASCAECQEPGLRPSWLTLGRSLPPCRWFPPQLRRGFCPISLLSPPQYPSGTHVCLPRGLDGYRRQPPGGPQPAASSGERQRGMKGRLP